MTLISFPTQPAAGRRSLLMRASLLALLAAGLAAAPLPTRAADVAPAESDNPDDHTLLQADEVSFDQDTDVVTATGHVEIQRGERILLADKIVYDRNADIATATGNVSVIDQTGTVFYFESIQVTGDLKEGLAQEVRVLLSDKSRMASRAFRRTPDGINELYNAVYSACDSCKGEEPLWQIKAGRVRHDSNAEMVYYNNAWIELGGIPVFYTPYLAHPDPTAGAKSGLLLPTIGGGRNVGAFYQQPYYIRIADNRDATITPFLTSSGGNGAIGQYRHDFREARLRLDASTMAGDPDLNRDFRGHVRGSFRWDMSERWRAGSEIHLTTDRTYLRRYNFEAPTWLTSNVFAERFTAHTYFSADAYYFQRQRVLVTPGSVPIVAPLLNYNYVSDPDSLGGTWEAEANSLFLVRETGTDTTRVSGRVGWSLPYTADYGGVHTFRIGVRADGYYARDLLRPIRGDSFTGTSGRVVPEASLEWRMPFVSTNMGFQQLLEPIVMGVVSPSGLNSESIPNEDSLDLQFDDSNLFTSRRFTGFDRVETGARINYGVRWAAFNENIGALSALVGQVYRFDADPVFTPLSGLNGHFSDYVGRVELTPHPYFTMQYRFRLDKDDLANRRSELGVGLGPDLFRVGVNYIFLKSDPTLVNPLSTEELYVSVSSRISQRWSIVAAHRHNLGVNGGSIRTDVGVTYEDECFIFGLDVAQDNTQDRDFKKGIAVLLRVSLKTIGDIKFNTDVGPQR